MAVRIEQIGSFRCVLGEGPVWDPIREALYLVDIVGQQVHCVDEAGCSLGLWDLPDPVGCLALRGSEEAVVALRHGFGLLNLASGEVEALAKPVTASKRIRFNDGCTDRFGHFFAGTMDVEASDPIACLYRLDADLTWQEVENNLIIANGTCVSPDGLIFYLADSARKVIWAYDMDPSSGSLTKRRVLVDVGSLGLVPDGCTVDAAGFLWSSCVGSGKIVRYDPKGRMVSGVTIPTRFVSSVAFGGSDLEVLFVTSIMERHFNLPDQDPLAGGLFAVSGLGTKGLVEARFAD